MKKPLIVALDVPNRTISSALLDELKGLVDFYKVGLELFLSEGTGLVSLIQAMGSKVFLDLKLNDIPNQVARACREMVKLQVEMFTIHTLGGSEMIEKAAESVEEAAQKYDLPRPKIIGVTILTSLNQHSLNELSFSGDIKELVDRLTSLGARCGLDGVVASPQDVARIKQEHDQNLIVITPGIRPTWSKANDQKRYSTPLQACQDGADYIVVGRPIINADKPREAATRILEEVGFV